MAGIRNIKVYQGDTYIHELRLRDGSNTAINITERTYSGQMRKVKTSDVVIATFDIDMDNADAGYVRFILEPNITSNIQSGLYWYDFQEVNNGVITTLIAGKVSVEGEVTRVG